jgi:hypothetical protein
MLPKDRCAKTRPNAEYNLRQITLSLAQDLEDEGYAPNLDRGGTIGALQSLAGGIFYAAAYLSKINRDTLGPNGLHNSSKDLIAIYRVGEGDWAKARDKYGCGYCKPGGDAPAEVNKVFPTVAKARQALQVALAEDP